jgi:STE24 endopeptidase
MTLTSDIFIAFTGLITAVGVWSIWGGDMFPHPDDPKGEPETWTREEMRRWLAAVCLILVSLARLF